MNDLSIELELKTEVAEQKARQLKAALKEAYEQDPQSEKVQQLTAELAKAREAADALKKSMAAGADAAKASAEAQVQAAQDVAKAIAAADAARSKILADQKAHADKIAQQLSPNRSSGNRSAFASGLQQQMQGEAKAAADAAKQLAEQGKKGRDALLFTLGGEELPEKVGKIKDAFAAAGNSSLGFGSRLSGLVGGLGMAAGASAAVASNVVGMVVAYAAVHDAVDAHVRTMALVGPSYEAAREAAHGLVDATQLLATREQLLDAGVRETTISLDQFAGKASEARGQTTDLTMMAAELTGAMRGYASLTGGDATQAQQRFLQAVQAGDAEGLARFGVSLTRTQLEAHNVGAAIHQAGQRFSDAAATSRTAGERLESLGNWFKNLGARAVVASGFVEDSTRTIQEQAHAMRQAQAAAEQYAAALAKARVSEETLKSGTEALIDSLGDLSTGYSGAKDQLLELTGATEAVPGAVGAVGESYRRMQAAAQEQAEAQYAMAQGFGHAKDAAVEWNTAGEAAATQTDALSQANQRLADSLRDATKAQGDMVFQVRDGEDMGAALARITNAARQRIEAARGQRQIQDAARRGLAGTTLDGQRVTAAELQAAGLGGASGGGGSDPLREAKRAYAELQATIQGAERVGMHFHESERKHHESLINYYRRSREELQRFAHEYAQHQQRVEQAARNEDQRYGESNRIIDNRLAGLAAAEDRGMSSDIARKEQASREAEAAEQARITGSASEQMYATFHDAAGGTLTAAQHMSRGVAGAFADIGGAIQNHIAAVVAGRETAAEAFQGMAKDALAALSTRAVGEALANLAGGFAALATYRYPEATNHFAAAAIWTAVAAVSGAVSAAIPSPQQAASAGGSAAGSAPKAASAVPPSSNGDSRPVYQISYYAGPSLHTKEQVQDELRVLLNDMNRR